MVKLEEIKDYTEQDINERIVQLLYSTGRVPDGFIDYLQEIGFFNSPCSGANHLAVTGGLARHSLNVYYLADKLAMQWLGKAYSSMANSIILVALLHDVGKCGQFGKLGYVENILKTGKQSESKPYEVNKALLPIPHEVRSLSHIEHCINLTEEEYYAILYHNGLYGPFKYEIQGKETPLYMLLHFADMWASRVLEQEEKSDEK